MFVERSGGGFPKYHVYDFNKLRLYLNYLSTISFVCLLHFVLVHLRRDSAAGDQKSFPTRGTAFVTSLT